MRPFTLHPQDRAALEHLTSQAVLTNEGRRAQAVLLLAQGASAQTVAERFRVSRQTVYNWLTSFTERQDEADIAQRLTDKKRSGRPRQAPRRPPPSPQVIDPLIATVIRRDPREFGYRSILWTASLFRHYLREQHCLPVSGKHVKAALERLKTQWWPPHPQAGHFPVHLAASGGAEPRA